AGTRVSDGGQRITLSPAGRRQRHAGQDSALGVLEAACHRGACRLSGRNGRIGRKEEGHERGTHYALETSDQPHTASFQRSNNDLQSVRVRRSRKIGRASCRERVESWVGGVV